MIIEDIGVPLEHQNKVYGILLTELTETIAKERGVKRISTFVQPKYLKILQYLKYKSEGSIAYKELGPEKNQSTPIFERKDKKI
ncbi:MAG: hypothetical protein N2558_02470 [Patescibacteria group bacterium]|nr:hypothetical protein [Patescibacteria group bacterium]